MSGKKVIRGNNADFDNVCQMILEDAPVARIFHYMYPEGNVTSGEVKLILNRDRNQVELYLCGEFMGFHSGIIRSTGETEKVPTMGGTCEVQVNEIAMSFGPLVVTVYGGVEYLRVKYRPFTPKRTVDRLEFSGDTDAARYLLSVKNDAIKEADVGHDFSQFLLRASTSAYASLVTAMRGQPMSILLGEERKGIAVHFDFGDKKYPSPETLEKVWLFRLCPETHEIKGMALHNKHGLRYCERTRSFILPTFDLDGKNVTDINPL